MWWRRRIMELRFTVTINTFLYFLAEQPRSQSQAREKALGTRLLAKLKVEEFLVLLWRKTNA